MIERIKKLYFRVRAWLAGLWSRHQLKIVIGLLLACLFVAYFWTDMAVSIYSGERGMKWKRFTGTNIDRWYGEGFHLKWPWDKMYIYNLRVQSVDDSMSILTSEGVTVSAHFTYRYFPDQDSIAPLHQTLGPEYGQTYVRPEVRGAAMAIIGDCKLEQLHRLSTLVIQSTIKSYLTKQLWVRNIMLEDFILTKLILPSMISNAIEHKMAAEQLVLEYDFKLQTEEKERKRKQIEALGIQEFEKNSGISILKWRSLEATQEIAKSNNAKVVIIGSGKESFPIMLNPEVK